MDTWKGIRHSWDYKCNDMIMCKSESFSALSDSLGPHWLYSPRNSSGQNTGVSSLSLLQKIFLTQVSNPSLSHCRQILYQLSHKGSPRILAWAVYCFSRGSSQPGNRTRASCIAGGFFTNTEEGRTQHKRSSGLGSSPCCSPTRSVTLCKTRPVPASAARTTGMATGSYSTSTLCQRLLQLLCLHKASCERSISLPCSTDGETGVQKLNRLVKVRKLCVVSKLPFFFKKLFYFLIEV